MSGFWQRLAARSAETDLHARDRRLRGRTYAISFERVWSAALAGADGGLRRWSLVAADDRTGVIHAKVRTSLTRREGIVHVDVGLDENAQTRVDARAMMLGNRGDLGASARAVAAFLRYLDAELDATPAQILDATRTPSWTA